MVARTRLNATLTYIVCLVSSVGIWIGTLCEAGTVLNDTDQ